jgi:hypothetical protein
MYWSSFGGNFGLTVSPFDIPQNDLCSGAVTVLPNNGTIFGSTAEATSSVGPSVCSSFGIPDDDDNINDDNPTVVVAPESPDLWYRVAGTGGLMMASTCGDKTTYDSKIEILEALNGTCATLTCVAYNDDSCGGSASQIEWFATLGKTYFIRVFGFSQYSGPFQLTVTTP